MNHGNQGNPQPTMSTERETFLAERRSGIGASDLGAILGLDPYRTPARVWHEKVHGDQQEPTPAMWWGTLLEPIILERYSQRMRAPAFKPHPNCFRRDGWKLCHPDAFADLLDGSVRDVQIKTVASGDGWGEPGSDLIPDHIHLQILWEMHVLRAQAGIEIDEIGHVVPLIGPPTRDDLRIYEVRYDEELVGRAEEICARFWHDHVLTKRAPDPSTLAELNEVPADPEGKVVRATLADLHSMTEYEEADDAMRGAELRKQRAAFKIKVTLGDAVALVDEYGSPIITFKPDVNGKRSLRTTKWWGEWKRRQLRRQELLATEQEQQP